MSEIEKSHVWVGIDLGKRGYVAFLGTGTDLTLLPLPTARLYPNKPTQVLDSRAFLSYLKQHIPAKEKSHVLIEAASRGSYNLPATRFFPLAVQMGQIISLMELESYPYTLIHARSWQLQILGGGIAGSLTKSASMSVAWQRFPQLRDLSKAKLKECADAVCLALLCRRMFPTPEAGAMEAAKKLWKNLNFAPESYVKEKIRDRKRILTSQNVDPVGPLDGDSMGL